MSRQQFESEMADGLVSIGIEPAVAENHVAQFRTATGYSDPELQAKWQAHQTKEANGEPAPESTASCPDDEQAQPELYLTINELKALGWFARRGDVRGWTNNICILIKNRTCRIVSTDGHTMMTKVMGFDMDGHYKVFIPRNIAKMAKQLRGGAVQSLKLTREPQGWMVHFGDGHCLALPERDDAAWLIPEGRLDQLIQNASSDAAAAENDLWFDASYLARIGRAAALLGGRNRAYLRTHGESYVATVEVGAGYIALVMPIKGEPGWKAQAGSKR